MKKFFNIFFISLAFASMMLTPSCQGTQSTRIVGVWEWTFMDRLPLTLPRRQWEFTADNKVRNFELPENNIRILRSEGQYSFTKNGRFEIVKFDTGYNGEWIIVTLKKDVLRIVLKEFVDDQPAGQTLLEFKKVF
jgi:hypothetical protein